MLPYYYFFPPKLQLPGCQNNTIAWTIPNEEKLFVFQLISKLFTLIQTCGSTHNSAEIPNEKRNKQTPKTCLLLQSSPTTLSRLKARITLRTSEADCSDIWVVPISQMSSGSVNSFLHGGTGPYWLLLIRTKVPLWDKSSNSGWVSPIELMDFLRISFLKSKSAGGGITEADALHMGLQ